MHFGSNLVKYTNDNIIVGDAWLYFNCAFAQKDKSGGCPVGKKGAVV